MPSRSQLRVAPTVQLDLPISRPTCLLLCPRSSIQLENTTCQKVLASSVWLGCQPRPIVGVGATPTTFLSSTFLCFFRTIRFFHFGCCFERGFETTRHSKSPHNTNTTLNWKGPFRHHLSIPNYSQASSDTDLSLLLLLHTQETRVVTSTIKITCCRKVLLHLR